MGTIEPQVHILIRCPQCGGDMDLLEETQVVRCGFCSSSLLVAGRRGVLRYVIDPKLTDVKRAQAVALAHMKRDGWESSPNPVETFLFYAPFWRLQGTAFRWVFGARPMRTEKDSAFPLPMDRVKELFIRVFDHTLPGNGDVDLGISNLGVRPQVLQLRPLQREHLHRRSALLPLTVPFQFIQSEAAHLVETHWDLGDLVPEVILQRSVGLRFSVVHAPIWYVEVSHQGAQRVALIDAVSQRVIQTIEDGAPLLQCLMGEEAREPFPFDDIRFLPFRCPNCGWDFPFRPTSEIHLCPTCHRLWGVNGKGWKELDYDTVLPPDGHAWQGLLWAPFWRYRAHLTSPNGTLETMADLYRMAPPPRSLDMDREARRPIHLYVPAMRVLNPKMTQDLASRLTYLQPEVPLGRFPEDFQPQAAGGSLPESDAREMGPVILGAIMPPLSRHARSWLKECDVQLQQPRVLFFPFARVDLFWKELRTDLTFAHGNRSGDLPQEDP